MNECLRLKETSGLPASEPSGCSPRQAESPESLAWKCWLILFRSWGPLQQGAGAGLKLNILERSSRVPKGHLITSFHFWEWGSGM